MNLEKKARKLINDIEEKFSYMVEYGNTKEPALEIAIMMVEREIEDLKYIQESMHSDYFFEAEKLILDKQELLTILESKI